MRLDKFLSHNGFGTRKDVRKLIKQKAILVNGDIIKDHGFILDLNQDEVRVYNEIVDYVENIYIMMNKPQGVICSTESELYPSVLELLDFYRNDLMIVGRLDVDTEGLLLITTDGKFSHEIAHGKKEVYKTYEVTLEKDFDTSYIQDLEKGIELSDGLIKPASVEVLSPNMIRLSIAEGRYHQVKRMMHACENEVTHLTRISIGNITLDETLDFGQYRHLSEDEINNIR